MAIVGAVTAEMTAWVDRSRTTKQEDQTHSLYGLFFLILKLHLPGQTVASSR
jgi:hypothetical protein